MQPLTYILAAILIGTSLGALLSRRNSLLTISSAIAIVLGIVAIVIESWTPLAVGLVIFLVAQAFQRDTAG